MNNAILVIRDRESHSKAIENLKGRGFRTHFRWVNVEEYISGEKTVVLDLVYRNERARRLP